VGKKRGGGGSRLFDRCSALPVELAPFV